MRFNTKQDKSYTTARPGVFVRLEATWPGFQVVIHLRKRPNLQEYTWSRAIHFEGGSEAYRQALALRRGLLDPKDFLLGKRWVGKAGVRTQSLPAPLLS